MGSSAQLETGLLLQSSKQLAKKAAANSRFQYANMSQRL